MGLFNIKKKVVSKDGDTKTKTITSKGRLSGTTIVKTKSKTNFGGGGKVKVKNTTAANPYSGISSDITRVKVKTPVSKDGSMSKVKGVLKKYTIPEMGKISKGKTKYKNM